MPPVKGSTTVRSAVLAILWMDAIVAFLCSRLWPRPEAFASIAIGAIFVAVYIMEIRRIVHKSRQRGSNA